MPYVEKTWPLAADAVTEGSVGARATAALLSTNHQLPKRGKTQGGTTGGDVSFSAVEDALDFYKQDKWGSWDRPTTAGTANVQTITTDANLSAYTAGMMRIIKIGSGLTNTGAVTLNENGLGAQAVLLPDGTPLSGGELQAGQTYLLYYFPSLSAWFLFSGIQNAGEARNLLPNGGFDVWMANEANNVIAANGATAYGPENWYVKNGMGTTSQLTIVQGGGILDGSKYRCVVTVTTAPTASQAGVIELYCVLSNRDSLPLYNKTASFFAFVRGSASVNQVGVQFFYATSETKPTSGGSGTAIGSEQLYTVNLGGGAFLPVWIAGQALGTSMTKSGVIGVRIRVTGVASGNIYDLANGFEVEQAMLTRTAQPCRFARCGRTYAEEKRLCKWTYRKTFPDGTAPATNAGLAGALHAYLHTSAPAYDYQFDEEMRSTPTRTYYNPSAANANWRDETAGSDIGAVVETDASTRGVMLTCGSTGTVGHIAAIHSTDDARI